MKDKILGGIVGLAVGDALGVPVEFRDRRSLKDDPVTDMRGYGTYKQPPGTWSDDTSMTLCLLDSLANGLDYADIMKKFLSWYRDDAYTAHDKRFDIGGATRRALERFEQGIEPLQCGGASESDNGNGSLMRILPLAFYLRSLYRDEYTEHDESFDIIHNVSSLTHAHKRSMIACGIYLAVAERMFDGYHLRDGISSGITRALAHYEEDKIFTDESKGHYYRLGCQWKKFTDESGEEYCRVWKRFTDLRERDIKSSGYVVDTLEAALWCLLKTKSYKDCVLKAVNLGGDTDTVAALAGGLAGIYYGYDAIPKEWTEKIARFDYIEDLCDKLSTRVSAGDSKFSSDDLKIIQERFHELILKRAKPLKHFLADKNKRLPVISNEIFRRELWYTVPGMYGGFAYKLTEKEGKPLLTTDSWCRICGGSGQTHEITVDGCVLTEEGFV